VDATAIERKSKIEQRLETVTQFKSDESLLSETQGMLREIGDLQRLCSKVALKRANPKNYCNYRAAYKHWNSSKIAILQSQNQR
jgi:DNA mismatch repair protein MutS